VLPQDMYRVPPINLTTYGACINQASAQFGATVLRGLTIRAMRSELYSLAKQSGMEAEVQRAVVPVIDKFHVELKDQYGGRLRPLMGETNVQILVASLLKNVEKEMKKEDSTAFAIGGILLYIKTLNIPFSWKLSKSSKTFENPALDLFYAFSMQVVSLLARIFVLALYLRLSKVNGQELKTNPRYQKILYFIKSATMALKMKLPKFDLQYMKIPTAPGAAAQKAIT